MTYLIPIESSVSELEESFTPALWQSLLNARENQERSVALLKFKFGTSAPLNKFFRHQRTSILFENPDLSRMIEGVSLFVSGLYHKSFIEVAEGGAEAAATTAIVLGRESAPELGPAAILNRPFLFAIHDEATGAILFFGRLDDPILVD